VNKIKYLNVTQNQNQLQGDNGTNAGSHKLNQEMKHFSGLI
jgi:hypothetical protein